MAFFDLQPEIKKIIPEISKSGFLFYHFILRNHEKV
jgi:hypothetical protein